VPVYNQWGTNQRPDQIQLISDPPRIRNLLRGPLASTPIKRPSTLNNMVESAHNFLHGCLPVWTVRVHQVDILESQPIERSPQTLDDMFPRQPNRILCPCLVYAVGCAEVDFGADHDIAAPPSVLVDRFAHYYL